MSNYSPDDYRSAQAAVRTPAFLLILTGILTLLGNILYLAALPVLPGVLEDRIANIRQNPNLTPEEKEGWIDLLTEVKDSIGNPLQYAVTLVEILFSLLILIGGIQMWNLSGMTLPVTASILAIIPCISGCCCLLGLPAGIWSLVVLSRPDVKYAIAQR